MLLLHPADGGAGAEPPPPLPGERRVVLASRIDLCPAPGGTVPGLAALPDPAGVREVVAPAFLAALELPAEPWQPARALPFESSLCEALEHAASADSRDQERGLLGWLGLLADLRSG